MRRAKGVSFVILSLLALAAPASSQESGGAGSSGEQASGFQLEQNYPNPFNPATTIPFLLGEDLFVDGSPAVVTIRIYNLLQQEVAVPVPKNHPMGEVPLLELEYTQPGRHEAYWDGNNHEGRQVASGLYLVQLTVNGMRTPVMKMFVAK